MFSNIQHNRPAPTPRRARLNLEVLESRLTPYSISGNAWLNPQLITIGFVPDGTVIGANASGPIVSNLQSTFNNHTNATFRATWKDQILRAAQAWAQQTNINFAVITDNGAEIGSGLYQQGDPNMADIRIGGYNFGSTATVAQAYMPAPINNTSFAGDIQFNTSQTWNLGSQYDLYTVAAHEIGHALGLYHSSVIVSTMNGGYTTVKSTLNIDDINGIRAVTSYQGARRHDGYDLLANNNTFGAASDVTLTINPGTKTALVGGLDLTTTGDVDFYKFTVPVGLDGTLNVKVQSSGLSLLTPTLTLLDSAQNQIATISAASNDYDGTTLTLSANNVMAGQTYYVRVGGLNLTAFSTGNYALALGLGGVAAPPVAAPDTLTLNGLVPSVGGGQAVSLDAETQANTFASGAQDTFASSAMRATAIDGNGNYVVVWTSSGQDGSGKGIYAQRFTAAGAKLGSEFRVNTTTAGDQDGATIAMDAAGNFVVTWTSAGQDGSGKGVYFQRFNAVGVAQGVETRANTTTASDQSGASVAMASNGTFVVAWMSWNTSGSAWNIYAQRFDAAGTKVGGETLVNTTTAGSQENAQVSMNATGAFVIVWESDGQDGSGFGIYGQRFDAAGTKLGGEFRVNSYTASNQYEPAVAIDSGGNFVVTWTSYGQDGAGYGISAQRYNAAGTKLGGEFTVNTIKADHQTWSTIAMDGNGNFLVTWTSWDLDGSRYNIHGQQYSAGGALVGDQFRVNTTTAGDQKYSSSAMNLNGQAVITWFGQGGGDADGVYFQRYRINAGSGLHNMEGVPHGYAAEGHDCEDHAGHTHEEEAEDACGCATCSTAVADVQPVSAVVRQIATNQEHGGHLLRALVALNDRFAQPRSTRQQETEDIPSQEIVEVAERSMPGHTRQVTFASPQSSGQEASGDAFFIGSPAFGHWQWLSPLTV